MVSKVSVLLTILALNRCNPPTEKDGYNLHCTDNCQPPVGTAAVYSCEAGYSLDGSAAIGQQQRVTCFSDITTNFTQLQRCRRKINL